MSLLAPGCPVTICTINPYIWRATRLSAGHHQPILTEIYIQALLVDEELADQVWEAWDADELSHADGVFAPFSLDLDRLQSLLATGGR